MTSADSSDPGNLADTVSRSQLEIVNSSFRKKTNETKTKPTIGVEGRFIISPEDRSLVVDLKMEHDGPTASGDIQGGLTFGWPDTVEVSEESIISFAEQYGAPTALPAVAAILVNEARRYGLRIAFPPPNVAQTIGKTLADHYRNRSTEK